MNKEWTPRRGRLLTTIFCDGRATYRLWYIFLYTLRFYLCFYTFITQVYHNLKKINIPARIPTPINPLNSKKLLFTHNHFIINKNFNFHSQIIPASALIPHSLSYDFKCEYSCCYRSIQRIYISLHWDRCNIITLFFYKAAHTVAFISNDKTD